MVTKRKETETTDVATTDDMPKYLRDVQGQGLRNDDNFDSSDVVVPRVKLLQALSDEVEAFDHAKAGNFWHTGFDTDLGPEIDFVVCARKKKYMLVAPLEDGQGILARADDGTTWDSTGSWQVKMKGVKHPIEWTISDRNVSKSGLLAWGTSNPDDPNSPPAATLFYEYLVLLPEHLDLGPCVISLTRSQIRRAKKGLNDKIRLHESQGRPMQALVFRAVSFNDKNADGNDFKNWQFRGNGFTPEELYRRARELKDLLKDYRVADEEVAAAGDESSPSPGADETAF